MLFEERASGILLHPTSLPGGHGIGDFGPGAYHFAWSLQRAKQQVWQILPLGPISFGNSPYQAYSAFAINPLLISLEKVRDAGLLQGHELPDPHLFPQDKVDYPLVSEHKLRALTLAYEHFSSGWAAHLRGPLNDFLQEQSVWLPDYALFMALKEEQEGKCWNEWPRPLALREPAALAEARARLADVIARHEFWQFLAFRQWSELKGYANGLGIRILGDAPIYVAFDSSDTWSQPQLYWLDEAGQPTDVAGVPPDYFSKTGQRWGNPLYRWERMAEDGYAWWQNRLRCLMKLVDLIRIDHFRGFAAFWAVPAAEETAIKGKWVKGPGYHFFEALEQKLGKLPIIAEDLGIITRNVLELRLRCGFPGMKILQFAFGGDAFNSYLPHNHEVNCVIYTGTHDNNTAQGWLDEAKPNELKHLTRFWGTPQEAPVRTMIRMALSSVAQLAVLPVQDLLGLGADARMNTPGTTEGNWGWRLRPGQLQDDDLQELAELTILYARIGKRPKIAADEAEAQKIP